MGHLFPKVNKLIHGGDYNPEQWLDRPDILKEDIRLMKKAHMNCATLGVFSWSFYEPEEGVFSFQWLKNIMDDLYENGIYTILATPSGARPAWLDEKYPEAMRVSAGGVRDHHGQRHNHCMSSEVYRQKVKIIDQKLAAAFGSHPGLILWHISNEFGGECYCGLCKKRFQQFLHNKYHGDIDELNHEWWTGFWSHRYSSFEQIEPPYENGEQSIGGLLLDWRRFTTWNTTDFMNAEIGTVHAVTPDIPVTANFMKLYEPLDYYEMSKSVDIISWDNYPMWNNDFEPQSKISADVSFDHSIMRSFKRGQPFMMMESAPGLVNWQPYNQVRRPGMHRYTSLQAVACGSDTVQYFQWRKGRGSFEQYHGAVVDHLGRSDTRIFREVADTGEALLRLEPVGGSVIKACAALLFDWNSRWALKDMAGGIRNNKGYEETCREQYGLFLKNDIVMDIVSPNADLSDYKIIVAPMLYVVNADTARRLRAFVEDGGCLVATYLTGYVGENTLCHLGGFPGGGLGDVFGLYAEELDTLYPAQKNRVVFDSGESFEIRDFCEIIKTREHTQVLARYGGDFYENTPVVTMNRYGRGTAVYVGARINAAGMEQLYRRLWAESGIPFMALPEGVEHYTRYGGNGQFDFYLNSNESAVEIDGVTPGMELFSGSRTGEHLRLEPFGVAVIAGA